VLGEELARRRGQSGVLVSVPLENGKFVPYLWVFQHRLLPLIVAKNPYGARLRPNLQRLILVTEWWDSCSFIEAGRPYWNLPGRAWALPHYVDDVISVGVDSYNKNYLDHLFRRVLSRSVLVQSRGTDRIVGAVQRKINHQVNLRTPAEEARFLASWQRTIEGGVGCIGAPEQLAAFHEVLAIAGSLGLETTVILFPRKPATLTDQARSGTLMRFRELASKVASQEGARFIDLTSSTPLDDADFMDDYDHVNAKGNQKFAKWALDNDLSFLMEPRAGAP
jgi:hypothetical protein